MKIIVNMPLEKAAAKSGGDKYTGEANGESISVYVPQSISRAEGGKAAPRIVLTIDIN